MEITVISRPQNPETALFYGKAPVFPSHFYLLFQRAMFWGSRRWWRDWRGGCCRGGRVPVGAVWEGPWSSGGPVMLQASSRELQAVLPGCVCPLTATWPSGPISTQAKIPSAASAEPPGRWSLVGLRPFPGQKRTLSSCVTFPIPEYAHCFLPQREHRMEYLMAAPPQTIAFIFNELRMFSFQRIKAKRTFRAFALWLRASRNVLVSEGLQDSHPYRAGSWFSSGCVVRCPIAAPQLRGVSIGPSWAPSCRPGTELPGC